MLPEQACWVDVALKSEITRGKSRCLVIHEGGDNYTVNHENGGGKGR
jgi:Cu/Zn superoxide dismutase